MSEVLNNDVFGIFNQKAEDVVITKEEKSNKIETFLPDPEVSPDKKWRGMIKFLPNVNNTNRHAVEKVTYWLKNPQTGKKISFDSAKSENKYADCPVGRKWYEWSKLSNDVRLNRLADEELRYNKKSTMLIQIVSDLQNPSNNGKIMFWNVPSHVRGMIDSKLHPSKVDIEIGGKVPENIFAPIKSSILQLGIGWKVTSEGKFRTWESGCEWAESKTSMRVDGVVYKQDAPADNANFKPLPAEGSKEMLKLQERIIQILQDEETPNLEDLVYKPESAEKVKIIENILAIMEGTPVNKDEDISSKIELTKAPEPTKTPETVSTTKTDVDAIADELMGDGII